LYKKGVEATAKCLSFCPFANQSKSRNNMKIKHLLCLSTALLLFPQPGLNAQSEIGNKPYPRSSISVYASSLLLASVANLSFEHLWKPSEESRLRVGFTTGYTLAVQHWSGGLDDIGMGPHLAFTLLAGKTEKFFELKLGGAAIFSNFSSGIEYEYALPVISLGFRREFQASGSFFRCALSTAGVGVGVGFTL
jgi:hypothetical protein